MPSGGQGARPAGNGSTQRRGESLTTQYLKNNLGLDDSKAREWDREIN
jgi:hypothetical protein